MNVLLRLLVVAIAALGFSYGGVARAEDVASDIPGSPWVGPSISSTVGGSTVDRVWRLELPEGRVGILRLAGEASAELGLYLFDSSARSVLIDNPIKSSAKPGGTQSIAASLPAGTYYVNVNGRNVDRAYTFTLSISLFPDLTPPTAQPRVAGGGSRVSGSSVVIAPGGYDGLSGIATVRYRIVAGEWSEWSPDVARLIVPIPLSEGPYAIDVQVRNGVGLISAPAQLTVIVDQTPPTATVPGMARVGVTTSAKPTIRYVFNEPMQVSSLAPALVVSDFGGVRVDGDLSYDPIALTATFKPTASLTLGTTYAVDMVGARDVAGNTAASPGGWSFTYLTGTSMRAIISNANVMAGALVTLRGTSSGVPSGSRVAIDWRPRGGAGWTTVGSGSVRNGLIYATLTVETSGTYRFSYLGDATHAPSQSTSLAVTVKPDLQLSGAGGYVRKRTVGSVVTLRGYSNPSTLPMVFARYRCNSSFTSCTRVGGETVMADVDGRAAATWVATRGYWAFRLKTASTGEYAAASTELLKFRVP